MSNPRETTEVRELAKAILRTAPTTARRWSETHGGSADMVDVTIRLYKRRSWLRTQLGLPPASTTEGCRLWRFAVQGEPSSPFFLRKFGKLYHISPYGTRVEATLESLQSMSKVSLEDLKKVLDSPYPPGKAPRGLYAEA